MATICLTLTSIFKLSLKALPLFLLRPFSLSFSEVRKTTFAPLTFFLVSILVFFVLKIVCLYIVLLLLPSNLAEIVACYPLTGNLWLAFWLIYFPRTSLVLSPVLLIVPFYPPPLVCNFLFCLWLFRPEVRRGIALFTGSRLILLTRFSVSYELPFSIFSFNSFIILFSLKPWLSMFAILS